MLTTLRAHCCVGGTKLFGMTGDSALGVQIHCLEWASHRPSKSQTVSHHPINVLDRGYAIPHQAVRFAKQRPLQPVEYKSEWFFFHQDRRQVH